MFIMFNMCVCAHACVCTHAGGCPRISKILIKLEQILFEDFESVAIPPPMGLWVKSCEITKNVIKLDLIEIIQFCLEI